MVAGVVAGVAAGAVNGGGGGKVMRFAALGGVAGLGGQGFVDWRAERRSRLGGERKSFLTWLTTGKYSVFRKLSDAEYVDMLEAQLIRVEAEIAVLEDKVRSLKGSDGGVGDAGG